MNVYQHHIGVLMVWLLSAAMVNSYAQTTSTTEETDNSNTASSGTQQRKDGRYPRQALPKNRHQAMVIMAHYLPKQMFQWIGEGDNAFLVIWQKDRSGKAKGALMIIHAEGEHPAWPQTTKPLHDTLPDYGWATMAISLPQVTRKKIPQRTAQVKTSPAGAGDTTSAPQAEADSASRQDDNDPPKQPADKPAATIEAEVEQRLTLALDFLNAKGQFNIAVMGNGIGAIRAHRFIKNTMGLMEDTKPAAPKPISAFLMYNARNHLPVEEENYSDWFFDPEMPVLDLYTVTDKRNPVDAYTRKILSRQTNKVTYRQSKVPEMSHETFWGENLLTRRVRSFLKTYVEGVEIDKKNTGR